MTVLVDSNLVLRVFQPAHPMHADALGALVALRARGDLPCVVPQVLYEFWAVSTRLVKDNGRGLTPVEVDAELTSILTDFRFLPDSAAVFPEWRSLVAAHSVSGKPSHDARLVAAMRVHGLTHLLTFNLADFTRYPIVVLDPAVVAAPPTP